MPQRFTTRREAVHPAESEAEARAVQQFQNRCRAGGLRPPVRDLGPRSPESTVLYTGAPPEITGAIRLRHWPAGRVPARAWERLSMDLFPFLDRHRVAEIGCLAVRPGRRSEAVTAALLEASYLFLAAEKRCELVFCACPPELARSYRRFGMRPFGGRRIHTPHGPSEPLVAIPSDLAYYEAAGSFLAPAAHEIYRPGGRPRLDTGPYRHLLATDALEARAPLPPPLDRPRPAAPA